MDKLTGCKWPLQLLHVPMTAAMPLSSNPNLFCGCIAFWSVFTPTVGVEIVFFVLDAFVLAASVMDFSLDDC